jgi:hypothetical protein
MWELEEFKEFKEFEVFRGRVEAEVLISFNNERTERRKGKLYGGSCLYRPPAP